MGGGKAKGRSGEETGNLLPEDLLLPLCALSVERDHYENPRGKRLTTVPRIYC